MREIKFREWETERKTLVIGEREEYDDSVGFRFAHEEGGERILMQYTNIKDKNDREIYDGDIIKFTERTINGGTFTHVCQVFQSENGAWRVEGYPDFKTEHKTRGELYSVRHFCEVIGNKYENPELLKEERS